MDYKNKNTTAFISAGHNPKGIKVDPGAVANGLREADLTVDFRNTVVPITRGLGVQVITDRDDERLGNYLRRIQTGNGSVVIEFHFDAAASSAATGATALIGNDADRLDRMFATELVNATATTLGIKNRGIKTESESHRGRLGLMRENGIVALLEICFITNENDVKAYQNHKMELATKVAQIIKKYEDLKP